MLSLVIELYWNTNHATVLVLAGFNSRQQLSRQKIKESYMKQEELDEIIRKHNLWLEDNIEGIKADLRGADLRGADLRGADLRWADLRKADLRRANLRRANLRKADLRWANLRGADLRGADLRGADLRGADLQEAEYSILSMFHIQFYDLSNDLTLELMRHDAEFTGIEKMNEWANGGPCPYEGMERDFLFQEKRELWKPGKPKLRGRELLIALFESQNIKHSL
jgi:hypothetical protein